MTCIYNFTNVLRTALIKYLEQAKQRAGLEVRREPIPLPSFSLFMNPVKVCLCFYGLPEKHEQSAALLPQATILLDCKCYISFQMRW